MKKIILTAAVLSLAATVSAQTMQDAVTLGQSNYYGTARSIGMANAVTAVGGDLGTVNVNPAGSAVAGYSQISFTPGLVISSNVSSYAPSFAAYHTALPDNPLPTEQQFGAERKQSMTKFALPNFGATLRFNTGRSSGLRSFTLGVVANTSNCMNEDFYASGTNLGTSISGSFASLATVNADGNGHMMPCDILHYSNPFNTGYYWNCVTGYWGGLINYNGDKNDYFGSAETVKNGNYYVAGALLQRFSQQTIGRKRDLVVNMGFDFNDCLFFGINIGFPGISYNYSQIFTEVADDPEDFPVTPEYVGSDGVYKKGNPTFFDNSRYSYYHDSQCRGIYGKFGIIWLPNENWRLGGAIQTPTDYTILETWQVGVDTYFCNGKHEFSNSDTGKYEYRFLGPWSFNAGAAYTFGTVGMLSVDYEMTGFGSMAFKTRYGRNDDDFFRVNRLCSLFCGPSHSVRAGLEFKPLPFLAVRAGYSFKSDPTYSYDSPLGRVDAYAYDANFSQFEKGIYTVDGPRKAGSDNIHAVSFGLGFISAGSFYSDLAFRMTSYPTSYISPYSAYIEGGDVTVFSPEIRTVRRLWDVALTVGWRF